MTPMPLGYRKPEDAKFMSKREVAAILHAAREVERDPRSYFMFALMYLLGLRIGEAWLLEWTHVGPLDDRGHPAFVMVPTLKQRYNKLPLLAVPVLSHPGLVAAAFDKRRQPKEERRVRSPYLFGGSAPGEHLSKSQCYRLFELCRGAARVRDELTPHAFRHTAATELGAVGMSHAMRRRFLRHTAHDVTDHYTHVKPEQWVKFRGALDLPPLRPLNEPAAAGGR